MNENTNGPLRDYCPKHTDLSTITARRLAQVVEELIIDFTLVQTANDICAQKRLPVADAAEELPQMAYLLQLFPANGANLRNMASASWRRP
jgi:hypothetical protein